MTRYEVIVSRLNSQIRQCQELIQMVNAINPNRHRAYHPSRLYASNAEKQRAYRQRKKDKTMTSVTVTDVTVSSS
jgi:hypothetical protein